MSDGVSIVTDSWRAVLESLGWEVQYIAGEGKTEITIDSLRLDSTQPVNEEALSASLDDSDLIIAENILTIPMNLKVSRGVKQVLTKKRVVVHHHDPPWQRDRFKSIDELPYKNPNWINVTINKLTQHQFEARGFSAINIYNAFDTCEKSGDRSKTRSQLGIKPGETLSVHPVRPIPRKNISKAIDICKHIDATYWLPSPLSQSHLHSAPEPDRPTIFDDEGYLATVERQLSASGVKQIRQPVDGMSITMPDLYAASDLVLFPSSWEGFGNPPLEAAIHSKPVVVGDYPVAAELRDFGFKWLGSDDYSAIRKAIDKPSSQNIETNRNIAIQHFSYDRLKEDLNRLIDMAGS